jgi:hypothetical protein
MLKREFSIDFGEKKIEVKLSSILFFIKKHDFILLILNKLLTIFNYLKFKHNF